MHTQIYCIYIYIVVYIIIYITYSFIELIYLLSELSVDWVNNSARELMLNVMVGLL